MDEIPSNPLPSLNAPQPGVIPPPKKKGCGCLLGCLTGCLFFFLSTICLAAVLLWVVDFGALADRGLEFLYKTAKQEKLIEAALPGEMSELEKQKMLVVIDEAVQCYFNLPLEERKNIRQEVMHLMKKASEKNSNSAPTLPEGLSKCLNPEDFAPLQQKEEKLHRL